MRAGVAYPPKPVPCELTFATQDPMQPWDMSTHQLIGTMVAEHFKGSWDEPLKKAVQEKACPVGADMAAINIITVLILIVFVYLFNRWSKADEGVTYA